MGNFNPGRSNSFNRGGDRPAFGGRDSGRPDFQKKSWDRGQRDGGRGPMFQATCSDCGKSCEVPFRPTGERPVYCNDCFGGKKNVSEGRSDSRPSFPRKDFNDRSSPRPSFESNKGSDDTKKQLEAMNVKLDRILRTIDNLVSSKNAQSVSATAPVQKKEEVAAVVAPVVQPKKITEEKTAKKEVAKTSVKKVAKKKK